MKAKNIIAAILLLFMGTSCEKWFDVSPKTEMKSSVLFSTESGYRDALIGIYGTMASQSLYGTDLSVGFLEVLAQAYDNVRTSTTSSYLNSAKYQYSVVTETSRIDNVWKQMYNAVANANIILTDIDKNKAVFRDANYNIVKGEVTALRALLHFDLLRLYAPSPVMGIDRKAIPYVDKYTNIAFPQLTVKETLDKIIADLVNARDLLKDADPYGPQHAKFDLNNLPAFLKTRGTRLNYYAATALLARVYLYMGDKANALIAAREVINSTMFPLYANSSFASENLFAISKSDLKVTVAEIYFPKIINSQDINTLTMSTANYTAIYVSGTDQDYRLNWFESLGSVYRIKKYDNTTVFPMIKVSEMYLIAAECEPTITVAIANFHNVLRAYRGLSPIDVNSTAAALTTEIAKEYRKEFYAEGQLFYYYKRLNTQKMPTITAFTKSEDVYILPIPLAEKDLGNIGK